MANIVKWSEVDPNLRASDALDAIFFEASATKSFASPLVRDQFRERWLGRYLRHYPDWVYVALDGDGRVIGYLLGCLDDPAQTRLFDDIGYFQALAALTARYPAQLHVNLAEHERGSGLGSRLVQRFIADASSAGCPGVHSVTARGMRNIGFYARNGFNEAGSVEWQGRELVFLARGLG